MTYGTAREDSVLSANSDDVALFGGTSRESGRDDDRQVDLLLCGSVHHLRSQIASHGRMGSDTTWLYELIKELDRRKQPDVPAVPAQLTEIVPRNRSVLTPEAVAHGVFGFLMSSADPRPNYGRLSGHARVLMDIDEPEWFARLVLATPLYIERPKPLLRRRWWPRRILPGRP